MWGEENGKGKEEMGNLLGNPILLHYYNKPKIRKQSQWQSQLQ